MALFVMMAFRTGQVKAQSDFVSAGIDAAGVTGSISASVGQTFYVVINSPDFSISKGVQQSYPGTFRWQLPITRPKPGKRNDFVFPGDLMADHHYVAFGCHSSRHQFLQALQGL